MFTLVQSNKAILMGSEDSTATAGPVPRPAAASAAVANTADFNRFSLAMGSLMFSIWRNCIAFAVSAQICVAVNASSGGNFKRYGLTGGGKFARRAPVKVCEFSNIDSLITEAPPPPEIALALTSAGVVIDIA